MKSYNLLVVDANSSGRFLLVWTLRQRFPRASIAECDNAEMAVATAAVERPDAIIAHRVPGLSCVELVRAIREANNSVPIVAVSGFEQGVEARAAGAASFGHFDDWKSIARAVSNAIASSSDVVQRN